MIVDCEHKTAPVQVTGYPSIRTPNIGRGWLILDNVNRVSEETYRAWTRRAVPQEDDLILAREAPIGNVALIPRNLDVCLGQRTVLIRPDKSKVEPRYLLYLLLSDPIQGQILSISNGATVHHLNMKDIRGLTLPRLPSLQTQRQLAGVISAYDELVENNTRRIAILEEMARALYREWFVDFRFPGHERVALVESDSGLVPDGWLLKAIGDVIDTLGGGTPSTKHPEYWDGGEIIWFSPSDLTAAGSMFVWDSAKRITELGLKQSSARLFPANSVMMTSRATIGEIAINTRPACTNQGFITCVPNESLSVYEIYFWLAENKEKIIGLASGATFREINRTTFRQLPVVIPEPSISRRFNDLLEPIAREIQNLLARNTILRRTRDLLLPALISGARDIAVGDCSED